jgi:hypothetical protein
METSWVTLAILPTANRALIQTFFQRKLVNFGFG